MLKQPLGKVFGFPINNMSATAERHRRDRLCPFNNRVPSCTKDKANDPLGVCSVIDGGEVVITCPIRFRQDWIIATDAANFFSKIEIDVAHRDAIEQPPRQRASNIAVVVVCDVRRNAILLGVGIHCEISDRGQPCDHRATLLSGSLGHLFRLPIA
jgi:hypothetical protein